MEPGRMAEACRSRSQADNASILEAAAVGWRIVSAVGNMAAVGPGAAVGFGRSWQAASMSNRQARAVHLLYLAKEVMIDCTVAANCAYS